MFDTLVPYNPKARSRLCRLCSRRISSICRIRSRDATSWVTAEKEKKNHQDVFHIFDCLIKNHKHAQSLPFFIFGEKRGLYIADICGIVFYLESLRRKWSRSDVKSSLSGFFSPVAWPVRRYESVYFHKSFKGSFIESAHWFWPIRFCTLFVQLYYSNSTNNRM